MNPLDVAVSLWSSIAEGLKRLTFRWRSARFAARELKRRGLTVRSFKHLRLTLYHPTIYGAARWRRPKEVAEAKRMLGEIEMRNDGGSIVSDGSLLWDLVAAGFAESASSPNQATALVGAELGSRLDGAGTDFDAKAAHLHPAYASRARELRGSNGLAIDQLVGSIAMLEDRREVFREWVKFPPNWMAGNPDLLGFVGELALDAGANQSADHFFQRCIDEGGSPRGYWKARRVLAGDLPREEALDYLADVEDYPLVRALLASASLVDREVALAAWAPATEIQKQLQWALRTVQLREADLLDDSIAYGQQGLREHLYTGAGLEAAKSLVQRSTTPGVSFHARDLSDALELALSVRNERRRWSVSSGPAAALAMKISQMLMDLDRSWKISQTPPEGEATIAESEFPEVRSAAIVLLADRGLVERARTMVDETTPEGIRLQVEALEAEAELDSDRANALWSRALAAIDDYDDKAGLAFRLATRGVVDPFVDTLRPDNAQIADEIETIAALFRDEAGAEAKARAAAQDNSRVAHALIGKLGRESRNAELAPIAERAALTWGDADDWLRAGRAYQSVGDLDKAIECGQKAIQVGGAGWGDSFSAYGLLTELHFHRDDFGSAEVTALAAIAARPDSTMARWALVLAKALAGDQDGAFESWKASPVDLPPRTAMEGSVWISFFRMHGEEAGTIETLLALVKQFQDDEQIRRLAIGALTFAPIERQPGQVDLGELIEEYRRDFPDTNTFQVLTSTTDDAEDLLRQMDEMSGPRPDLEALEAPLRVGTLPLGLASRVGSRLYAESAILRIIPARFGGPLTGIDEAEIVAAAVKDRVVVDTTALVSLAQMTEDDGRAVLALVADAITVTPQLVDSYGARESLNRESAGTFIPSSSTSGPRVTFGSEVTPAMNAQATRLVALFGRTSRVPNVSQSSTLATKIGELVGPWSSAVDYAIANKRTLWSDDAAMRRLAIGEGVDAFGTPSLLEYARGNGKSGEWIDSIEALLIHNGMVGIPFSRPVFDLAVTLDAHHPRGTAVALRFGGSDHAQEKVELALSSMAKVSEVPEALEGWARILWDLVSEVSPAESVNNCVILGTQTIPQEWINASTFSFVVRGWKAASQSDWTTKFTQTIQSIRERLVEGLSVEIASQFLLGLTSQLEDVERQIVTGIILSTD